MVTGLLAGIYGQSRIYFAMSRDGMAPSWLQEAPSCACWCGMLAATLATFFDVKSLASFLNIGVLLSYAMTAASVLLINSCSKKRLRDTLIGFKIENGTKERPLMLVAALLSGLLSMGGTWGLVGGIGMCCFLVFVQLTCGYKCGPPSTFKCPGIPLTPMVALASNVSRCHHAWLRLLVVSLLVFFLHSACVCLGILDPKKATPVTAYATDGTTGRSVRLGRDRSRGMGRPAKARSSSRGGGAAQGGHDAVCTVVVRFKMKSDVLDFAAGGALLDRRRHVCKTIHSVARYNTRQGPHMVWVVPAERAERTTTSDSYCSYPFDAMKSVIAASVIAVTDAIVMHVGESVGYNFGSAKCPCVGLAGLDGTTTVKLDANTSVDYPGSFAAYCRAWDNGRNNVSCKEGQEPGKDKGWCAESWCYVDPCNCELDEPATKVPDDGGYMPHSSYQGRGMWYSYKTCGGKDYWMTPEKKKELQVQTEKGDIIEISQDPNKRCEDCCLTHSSS
ncbi:unnamed protein product [Cladocopium goreaui]|uniref:Cationic amino acid transporter 9, chloroplastic n=1 Tax=Cladocopium goreaui TaxID=2562237 RepID=A0A9P1GJ73_9DINO|nr:unnamed protein product [Cladocopium goreaui]